jgi:hypothetical protein
MNPIFAIFKLINDENHYTFLGNGFFIDDQGTFVSAGHVFKDREVTYFIGFPADHDFELYPVTGHKIKYNKPYTDREFGENVKRDRKIYQCGPEYKDVAVAKTTLSNTPYLCFRRKRPYEYERLFAFYYKSSENCPRLPNKQSCFRLVNNKVPFSYLETIQEEFSIINRLESANIPYIRGRDDKYNLYNNCLIANIETHPGSSGSPILNQNDEVIGMIIKGDNVEKKTVIHLSKYITKKVRRLIKPLQ